MIKRFLLLSSFFVLFPVCAMQKIVLTTGETVLVSPSGEQTLVLSTGETVLALHRYQYEDDSGESYCAHLSSGQMLMTAKEKDTITSYRVPLLCGLSEQQKRPESPDFFSLFQAFFATSQSK